MDRLDAFGESILVRRALREPQHGLVRLVMYCFNERVKRHGLRALLVLPDFHLAIKNCRQNLRLTFATLIRLPIRSQVKKRTIELLSQVKGRKKLRLGEELRIF